MTRFESHPIPQDDPAVTQSDWLLLDALKQQATRVRAIHVYTSVCVRAALSAAQSCCLASPKQIQWPLMDADGR